VLSHIAEIVAKSSSGGLNKAQFYENGKKGFQYLDLNVNSELALALGILC
jgi:hypothetical protein